MRNVLSMLFLILSVNSFAQKDLCDKEIPILSKYINFDNERIALTRLYRAQHYGIQPESISIVPEMIVLHWTTLSNLNQSYQWFYPAKLQGRPDIDKEGALNVSAHFLVDRDGTIYKLMLETWMARHVIGLNNVAIGIENVGGVNNKDDLTSQQVASDAYLICRLKQKYPTIKYLIGHYQYLEFQHTPLWLEKSPVYITTKKDPGVRFLTKVRQQVSNLNLLSYYQK